MFSCTYLKLVLSKIKNCENLRIRRQVYKVDKVDKGVMGDLQICVIIIILKRKGMELNKLRTNPKSSAWALRAS